VFELSPTASGWKERIVYHFSGKDGEDPLAGVILDPSGKMFGTAYSGGANRYVNVHCCSPYGVVFEIIR
jgi:hypothetical protein